MTLRLRGSRDVDTHRAKIVELMNLAPFIATILFNQIALTPNIALMSFSEGRSLKLLQSGSLATYPYVMSFYQFLNWSVLGTLIFASSSPPKSAEFY